MNKYAINEYAWVPWDEEEDEVPHCQDCQLTKRKLDEFPCNDCAATRPGKDRSYFKPKSASQ